MVAVHGLCHHYGSQSSTLTLFYVVHIFPLSQVSNCGHVSINKHDLCVHPCNDMPGNKAILENVFIILSGF